MYKPPSEEYKKTHAGKYAFMTSKDKMQKGAGKPFLISTTNKKEDSSYMFLLFGFTNNELAEGLRLDTVFSDTFDRSL